MDESILLVDDEHDFLEVMSDLLRDEGYGVTCAHNGPEALALLEQRTFDLLLSDINMPGMKGFELLATAQKRYPALKRALITAYDVRDYLSYAKEYDIGNIITKSINFNFDEIRVLLRNILTEEVFGLDRYITGPIGSSTIRSIANADDLLTRIIATFPNPVTRGKFKHALGEIIINAVYYGAKNERGDKKELWPANVTLAPHEAITVAWGSDAVMSGVAVTDQRGALTKKDVLYWLERNTVRGADGLSLGILDEHGKGLFITRETTDRLIINIKRDKTTEIIMLNYNQGKYDGHKPLWIHEF
ncbi:MAG: response regulator [Chitinivibrionales bacterium]|nr:response regulator [Chitinivibrionales bacterium]